MLNKTNLELEACLADHFRHESEAAGFADPDNLTACTPAMRQPRHSVERPDFSGVAMRRGTSDRDLIHNNDQPFHADVMPSVVSAVKIVEIPDMDVASVRYIGPYEGIGKALGILYGWAAPRGLLRPGVTAFGAMYDIPGITPKNELRSDACICVPNGVVTKPPVYCQRIACKGLYASGHFEFVDQREFPLHWYELFARWLPHSDFQYDERPMMEFYCGDPRMRDGVFRVDICIPVIPK